MLQTFTNLSPKARIWVYQSNRKITKEEQLEIKKRSELFLRSWAAHGQDLLASAEILNDYFFIIATDESFNMASGCSIDTSFRFVQELGAELQIDFFNRSNLAFLTDGTISMVDMKDLKAEITNGNITGQSEFFNNTIANKEELDSKWLVKAEESWLKRYFKAAENV